MDIGSTSPYPATFSPLPFLFPFYLYNPIIMLWGNAGDMERLKAGVPAKTLSQQPASTARHVLSKLSDDSNPALQATQLTQSAAEMNYAK